MLWRRSAPPLFTPSTAPVPDAETLRRAALQASWHRGRWVARRRVAQRWLVWLVTHYVLPVALVSGLAVWVWQDVLPSEAWQSLTRWADSEPAVTVASPPVPSPGPTSAPATAPPEPETSAEAPAEYSPEGEALSTPLRLRLEPRWDAAAQAALATPNVAPAASGAESESESTPQLKPENWLHSKEP